MNASRLTIATVTWLMLQTLVSAQIPQQQTESGRSATRSAATESRAPGPRRRAAAQLRASSGRPGSPSRVRDAGDQ